MGLSQEIKEKALALGFDACGISEVEQLHHDFQYLNEWIDADYHGKMGYMARNTEKRLDVSQLVPNAKTVISVLLNYYPSVLQDEKQFYKISKYAYNIDYHYIVKDKLRELMQFIQEKTPNPISMRPFVDSAPVFDKAWAEKAGLGWIGKNTLLLNKKLGSFFFIGEIVMDLKVESQSIASKNYCGNCTACLDACPTNALVEPYKLDARKCISYHTIETKDEIPEGILNHINNYIYGCDICQDVCPWNSKAKPHNVDGLKLSDGLTQMKKETWEELTKSDFKRLFKSAPQWRTAFKKFKQNITQITSNQNPKA